MSTEGERGKEIVLPSTASQYESDVQVLREELRVMRALEPKEFKELMERVRQAQEVASQHAQLSTARSVARSAHNIPIETANDALAMAKTYAAFQNSDTQARGGGVIANQVNVRIAVDPDDIV